MATTNIALSGYGDELMGYFSFDIDTSFNNLLSVINIPISFVKIEPDW